MRTIETKTARSKLSPGSTEYQRLGQGLSVGYRRNASGAGVWIVRLSDGKQGWIRKRIALADDMAPADGRAVLSYQQAVEAVRRFANGDIGAPPKESKPKILTISDAINEYEKDLITRGGSKENATRLRHHTTRVMLERPIALLTTEEMFCWRESFAKKMRPSGLNRLMTCFKAALSLAATKDETLNSRVWKIGLAALPDAVEANNVVIPETTIRLIVQAAYKQSRQFGLLVETLAVTGARYSQIVRCQVRDLVGDRLMIPCSAKGRNKRASKTPVPIPSGLADRLRISIEGSNPVDVLLRKPTGESWKKSNNTEPFARAVIDVGEDPHIVTSYALRHSHITAQLLNGLPIQLVGKLHDTSVGQIEKHYAATITSHTDDLVRKTMASMEMPLADDKIVPLRR